MKEVIANIYSCIKEKKEIPEDILCEFSQDALRIVQSRLDSEIPAEFWKLQHYVEMFWRGRKFETEKDAVRIYQMGQLLSLTGMIRDIADEAEKSIPIEEYAQRWENRYLVYKGMHDEPGITHKRLAGAAGLSASSLSQMIAKTKYDGYFIYRIAGREKYYYLTRDGEKLYDILKSRIEQETEKLSFIASDEDSNTMDPVSDDVYTKIGAAMGNYLLENIQSNKRKTFIPLNDISDKTIAGLTGNELVKGVPYAETANSFWGY